MVVDNDKTNSGWPVLRYLIYYIHENRWADPQPIRYDPALSLMNIYYGFETLDAIMNFGTLYGKTEDTLFILSTAMDKSHYYDFISVSGCVRNDGSFEVQSSYNKFGGPLDEVLWAMESPVDAALVYHTFPRNWGREWRASNPEVVIFQGNSNFQISFNSTSIYAVMTSLLMLI